MDDDSENGSLLARYHMEYGCCSDIDIGVLSSASDVTLV